MCGIAGILNFNKEKIIEKDQLVQMRDSLRHRGPDGEGIFIDKNLGLSHRRLSIIDLSNNGDQPMHTNSGRYVIVFNGEIYNYKEFYAELKQKGCQFNTHSDTEVLLNLFEIYGLSCLQRLNGMFAMAIWDRVERELYLVRDRLGVKPLYYIEWNNSLFFASEIKAFFSINIPKEISPSGMKEWLMYRHVAGSDTIFKNVKKLLPGHWMHLKEDRSKEIKQWWHLGERIKQHALIQKPEEWFTRTFDESIHYRMESDVPVGVLLSGGLDSSAVALSLKKQSFLGLHTFNVGFKNYEHDESLLAKQLTEDLDFNFHSINVEGDDYYKNLLKAVYAQDEPIMHQNDPQLVAISNLSNKYVKVLLSGEGSDEILGGYVRYKALNSEKFIPFINLIMKLVPDSILNSRFKKLKRYANIPTLKQRVLLNSSNYFPDDFSMLGLVDMDIENSYRESIYNEAKEYYKDNITRQLMYIDQHTYLCSLNDRNDRTTMASSIECREPFMDFRLVEGIGSLNDDYFMKGKRLKTLMVNAFSDRFPDYIKNFRKVGFSVPFFKLIEGNEQLKFIWNNLEKSEVFDFDPLCYINKKVLFKEKEKYEYLLRMIFFLEIWNTEYIKGFSRNKDILNS